jgi:hypothetical protein
LLEGCVHAPPVIVYAVESFVRHENAERFIEEVRSDDP